MESGIWDLQGTENQNAIVRVALERCTFPFERLAETLRVHTGKTHIPVEWADLSRYRTAATEKGADDDGHTHIHAESDEYHIIEVRKRVLGLAWYEGRVSIERSLEQEPALAQYVFLSEGAHMVDFFYMTPEQRKAILVAYHPSEDLTWHKHGWFEETGDYEYWSWVGESFMNGFIAAFTDVPVEPDDPFAHRTTPEIVAGIRAILMPDTENRVEPYFGTAESHIFHDKHKRIDREMEWPTYVAATSAGRAPCKVCKPYPEG